MSRFLIFVIFVISCCVSVAVPEPIRNNHVIERSEELFPVSIVHINDYHARYEETNTRSTSCKPGEKCIGGMARAVTVIKNLLKSRKNTNVIYLNAGDSFQGTLWYNVGRWNVTSQFLNMLNADAMTLGNHEFDHGIEGIVPFLETIDSPVLASNIDDTDEPTIQNKYQKSLVIDRYDRKIGVIGVVLSTYDEIANTGRLRFFNESESIRKEAAELKKQGVDIIIVLSHCGLDVDYIIAQNAGPDVDVIVGGHSHTFMFTGDLPPGPDRPRDEYPAVVTHSDGHKVLIVQASAYFKYVGDITVYFDKSGKVVSWEGAPIFLDTDIEQDPEIMQAIAPWKAVVDQEGLREIGTTLFPLQKGPCMSRECNLGNFIADAMVYYYASQMKHDEDEWTASSIALIQTGGIRTDLGKGAITYGDLATTIPFENTIDLIDLRGDYLLEALEFSVSKSVGNKEFSSYIMLQVSGLKIVYNVTKPVMKRVVSVDVLCNKCTTPQYEPLDLKKEYTLILTNFFADGGDGYRMVRENKKNQRVGPIDLDIVSYYLATVKAVTTGNNGRITILK